jgi:RNA polymerase sigma-70 factor (ECF subfamily)
MTNWPAIVAEHRTAVWRTIYRLLNHEADAADCYQETFLAAYQAVGSGSVSNWRPFLTSIAARRAIDRLRARIRLRERFVSLEGIEDPVAKSATPLQAAGASELLDQVRGLLSELPDKQAEIFWLSCVEGLSHRDIGEQLHIQEGDVRVQLHRARKRLQASLEPIVLGERKDT